jgi:Short-chain fatty acyl coenzyme A regulators
MSHAGPLQESSTHVSQMPDGKTFFGVARTVLEDAVVLAHRGPQYAIGIGCDIAHAKDMMETGMITPCVEAVLKLSLELSLPAPKIGPPEPTVAKPLERGSC